VNNYNHSYNNITIIVTPLEGINH